jgi:isoleucyl-tRNA synthetase
VLAEAELIYRDNHVSHAAYVAFTVEVVEAQANSNISLAMRELLACEHSLDLLVWTTTPWTLTANMVCLQANFGGAGSDLIWAIRCTGHCGTP